MSIKTNQPDWLPSLTQSYRLTTQSESVLLAERDGQWVFRLDSAEIGRLTIRLCPAARPYQRVLAEAQGLLYLDQHNFPGPLLRLTTNEQPIFEWQAGSWGYVHNFVEGEKFEWSLVGLAEVANLLGRLHTLADTADPYPAQVKWLDELDEAIEWAEGCANDPVWGEKAQAIALILRDLSDLHGLPISLIHNDVHEGNLLRTPEGQLILLDWELAGMGQRLLEVALVLGWHCLWPAPRTAKGETIQPGFDFDAEWCKTFLTIYQQTCPLTFEEARRLGTAIRFVVGWYAAHDIKSEVEKSGMSEEGLAHFHWAVTCSITPDREQLLTKWAVETGAQAKNNKE